MGEAASAQVSQTVDIPGYVSRMDAATESKVAMILAHFPDLAKFEDPLIVGIGAGSGKVEARLQELTRASVLAIDLSMPMIETIKDQAGSNGDHQVNQPNALEVVQADATLLPIPSETACVLVASSVIHEIKSFKDDRKSGEQSERLFQEAFRVLMSGGRFIFRDFVLPEHADRQIMLEIGTRQTDDEWDLGEFLRRFAPVYQGSDTPALKTLIASSPEHEFRPGQRIPMSLAEAMEIVVHYSWSKRFEDEVKERYFYADISEYPKEIERIAHDAGHATLLVHASLELQPGYVDHIAKRFTLRELDGSEIALPPFTGIITIEKS